MGRRNCKLGHLHNQVVGFELRSKDGVSLKNPDAVHSRSRDTTWHQAGGVLDEGFASGVGGATDASMHKRLQGP